MDCRVTVVVDAGREPTWERWTDLAAWPEWNPACVAAAADGDLASGTRLDLQLRHPGGRDFYTRPRVTLLERPDRIAWEARGLGLVALTDVELAGEDDGTRITVTSSSRGALGFAYRMTMRPRAQAQLWSTMLNGLAGSFRA